MQYIISVFMVIVIAVIIGLQFLHLLCYGFQSLLYHVCVCVHAGLLNQPEILLRGEEANSYILLFRLQWEYQCGDVFSFPFHVDCDGYGGPCCCWEGASSLN